MVFQLGQVIHYFYESLPPPTPTPFSPIPDDMNPVNTFTVFFFETGMTVHTPSTARFLFRFAVSTVFLSFYIFPAYYIIATLTVLCAEL